MGFLWLINKFLGVGTRWPTFFTICYLHTVLLEGFAITWFGVFWLVWKVLISSFVGFYCEWFGIELVLLLYFWKVQSTLSAVHRSFWILLTSKGDHLEILWFCRFLIMHSKIWVFSRLYALIYSHFNWLSVIVIPFIVWVVSSYFHL